MELGMHRLSTSNVERSQSAQHQGDLGRHAVTLGRLLDGASAVMHRDRNAALHFIEQARALLRERLPSINPASPVPPTRSGLAPWQIRNVHSYIEEHLDELIRISALAALSRLSGSYFSVAFKRSLGVTPREYILRLRVERAQRLMLTTSQPLSEVAFACGFCDQPHMSNIFRRVVGSTPHVWRRTHYHAS